MTNPTHRAHAGTLDRRTLDRDFRRLTRFLCPGLAVLDIGCGTGAITAGIARAVGPSGRVVGVDRDPAHIEAARTAHSAEPNLAFELFEAASLPYRDMFDVAATARMLQWVGDPGLVIRNMVDALKPGGVLVALDYIHTSNQWRPDPPAAFRLFYDAFLAWRAGLGFDNEMGAHLPDLLESAGVADIESRAEDEPIYRGDEGFASRSRVWLEALDATGEEIVKSGHLTAAQLDAARDAYSGWISSEMTGQTLALRSATGHKRL